MIYCIILIPFGLLPESQSLKICNSYSVIFVNKQNLELKVQLTMNSALKLNLKRMNSELANLNGKWLKNIKLYFLFNAIFKYFLI